ncbi:MAG: carbon-nitrogen hydrolase family protein [Acidimicrobiales bacterium]|nr:carbon-nitrogen hydrolase family protein [Acidimicrobiales bacterium]
MILAAASAAFTRDLAFDLERARSLIADAHARRADLLVMPHGVLGGYLDDLDPGPAAADPPPALELGHPAVLALLEAAGDMTVCFGFTERLGEGRANVAVCGTAAGVLGVQRKVHLPPGEVPWYQAGDGLAAFDTPVGRLGMLIDYDKTFPEAARALALDGAQVLAFVCAWPLSRTQPASKVAHDRQSVLFDLYDRARAAENQVVVVTANLSGTQGRLRFLAQSKVVLPDGAVVARTGFRPGVVGAEVDVAAVVGTARASQHHLAERRPSAYGPRR